MNWLRSLCLGIALLPASSMAFISTGLTEALVSLGTVVEAGGSSGSSSGFISFIGGGVFPPPPRLWSLSISSRATESPGLSIVASNNSQQDPEIILGSAGDGENPDAIDITVAQGGGNLLTLSLASATPGTPLRAGNVANANIDAGTGLPRLHVDYGQGACLSASRSYQLDTLEFVDGALSRMAITIQCGQGFHATFHYDDTALTGNPSVIVSGNVWEDQNGDGVRQGSISTGPDGALERVRVNLLRDGEHVATMLTGEEGFRFQAPLATYSVEIVPPNGFEPTLPGAGDTPDRGSDVDAETARSPELTPSSGPLPLGQVSQATPVLSIGLVRIGGGRAELPVASTLLAPLAPGDRVTYRRYDDAGDQFYGADTVQPRARRRNRSTTYVVRDSAGNQATVSNDGNGLRLHAARVTIASGRRVPMSFSPPMVILPPEVRAQDHVSRGRVRVRRSGGGSVSARYNLNTDFRASCCDGPTVLRNVTGPEPHMIGLTATNVLEFAGARRGTPLAVRTLSTDTYAKGFGIVSSSIRFTDQETKAIDRRDGAGGSANADRTADLVAVNADAGQAGYWAMNGSAQPRWNPLVQGDDRLPGVAAAADLDGNGLVDIVAHDTESGLVTLQPGIPGAPPRPIGFVPPGAEIADVKDFNRDGQPDILWHDAGTGTLGIWTFGFQSTSLRSTEVLRDVANPGQPLTLDAGSRLEAVADFNGDGSSDFLIHDDAIGRRFIWIMEGLRRQEVLALKRINAAWHLVVVDDLNGDGRDDLLWHRPRGRLMKAWLMNGSRPSGRRVSRAPRGHTVAGSGDYNGDGTVDLLWQDEASGAFSIWLMRNMRVVKRADLGHLPSGFELF